MPVLVWMELNRQFPVKLDELCGLHLGHACNELFEGCIQELVNEVCLFSTDLRIRVGKIVLSHELICLHISGLIDLLLSLLSHLTLKIYIISEITLVVTYFLLHLALGVLKHLLLHLSEVRVSNIFFFNLSFFLSSRFIFTTIGAFYESLQTLMVRDRSFVPRIFRALKDQLIREELSD